MVFILRGSLPASHGSNCGRIRFGNKDIDHSLIRVHTRCMRKEKGAWEGWAVWPGDNAFEKRAFYEIKLK